MDEIIRIKDQFYILATSSRIDNRTRVLKHNDTFAVFDRYGDIEPVGMGELGIYHEGTRFLSQLGLLLRGDHPLLLRSALKEDNSLLTVDFTNPDFNVDNTVLVPRGTLHIFRSKFLWNRVCYERLGMRNYGLFSVDVAFSFHFDADFADIFEVRGLKRKNKGERLEVMEDSRIIFTYKGLDGITRQTRLQWSPGPDEISSSEAHFKVCLPPKEERTFSLTISCGLPPSPSPQPSYDCVLTRMDAVLKSAGTRRCEIHTSNEKFNNWLNRSLADLFMMTTDTPEGPYPYAGVPWFSTPFGRDGIITALECLWVNPDMARGVLKYLASMQAKEVIAEQDAEPGKILHETRKGEMAALGEVPFGRYYGSVDATPLFVVLAGAYHERTGDLSFIESIWPNIELALKWIDKYGDVDSDGFVEYARRSYKGLIHQGWKDSQDSVFHIDGTLAEGPIALCEVQAYIYDAALRASKLASLLGYESRAAELSDRAHSLAEQFECDFWDEELSTYNLALDGEKRPCRVRASNAGHCLFSGIANPEHAQRTARTLLGENMFCGWGIRTLAASEVRYNPMSYHNGSVWPHDNAIIAHGLARYGFKEGVLRLMTGLFNASLFVDLHRLPELFCGFSRRPGESPTLYPVACAPQSWSAASVFLLLQSCLGLSINAPETKICFDRPLLPEFLQEIQIERLPVGGASVDLLLQNYGRDVGINIIRREGPVEIAIVK
ncbi:MAG: amylo-alpha-1,6-glucosidase [Thermodesulfobacteriota bacterium]